MKMTPKIKLINSNHSIFLLNSLLGAMKITLFHRVITPQKLNFYSSLSDDPKDTIRLKQTITAIQKENSQINSRFVGNLVDSRSSDSLFKFLVSLQECTFITFKFNPPQNPPSKLESLLSVCV